MEPENPFFHQHVKSSSGLVVRDRSKMPMTNMTKIMRNVVPSNVKISNDAKDMIQQSASKYITLVSRKAKERCQSEYRKVMNADDLLWAIEKLGFDDYVGPLTTFLQRYRNIDNNGPTNPPSPDFHPNHHFDPSTFFDHQP